GDRDLDVRVQRLLVADRPPRLLGAAALAVTGTLVALPISLFLS
ncbi:M56 family peptidase, partial [Micromonospora sp. NPDC049799]